MTQRKLNKLYIDQYGQPVWARTLKELRVKAGGGHVGKMYHDDAVTKESFHVGYVVGKRWFNEYTPTRKPA